MTGVDVAPVAVATIVVPMQPPIEVSPNWTGKLKERMRAVAAFRDAAGWAAVAACGADPWIMTEFSCDGTDCAPVLLEAEIAWCCGRKRVDPTNAPGCLKALIDGVSDVLWAGQDRHVHLGRVTQTRGDGSVTVTLRRATIQDAPETHEKAIRRDARR